MDFVHIGLSADDRTWKDFRKSLGPIAIACLDPAFHLLVYFRVRLPPRTAKKITSTEISRRQRRTRGVAMFKYRSDNSEQRLPSIGYCPVRARVTEKG